MKNTHAYHHKAKLSISSELANLQGSNFLLSLRHKWPDFSIFWHNFFSEMSFLFKDIFSRKRTNKQFLWFVANFSENIIRQRNVNSHMSTVATWNLQNFQRYHFFVLSKKLKQKSFPEWSIMLPIQIYRRFRRMHQFQNWNVCFRSGFCFLCQ